jgi:hypothetical protein
VLRDRFEHVGRGTTGSLNLQFAICILYFAIAFCVLTVLFCKRAPAQIIEPSPGSSDRIQYGPASTIRYRIGAEVTAHRGACRDIVALVAVPLEWPEQVVTVLNEEFSSEVAQVDYRVLQGGVRQMMISIPRLPDGATARAVVTWEVMTRTILAPSETDDLVIPKRIPSQVRQYTGGSPYIEVQHRKIRSLGKQVLSEVDESASDWEKVEAIYDYVLEHVDYVEGPDKGALDTLRDGQADCQGRSMLFIALCRTNKIPARMVWVDGHAYPEFYLEDAAGEGYWFPCESAGSRSFGEMPLARAIFQKGDDFRVPERKDRLRYASDYLVGMPVAGSAEPKKKFIREQVGLASAATPNSDRQTSP